MKKMLIVALALVCMTMLAGCYRNYDFVDVAVKEIPKRTEQNDVVEEKSLTAEQIIDIYIENRNVWMFAEDGINILGGYGYLLLDMDFDGVCELIASQGTGSGVFSTNRFYRINEYNEVEEIRQSDDDVFGYDLYVLSQHIRLMKNTSDDSLFYYARDYTRVGYGENGTCYGKLYMKNGEIVEEGVFSEYHNQWDDNAENHIHSYEIYENGQWTELDSEAYEVKTTEFEKLNTDLNLKFKAIDASEYDKLDKEEQKRIFTESYKSFSYNS